MTSTIPPFLDVGPVVRTPQMLEEILGGASDQNIVLYVGHKPGTAEDPDSAWRLSSSMRYMNAIDGLRYVAIDPGRSASSAFSPFLLSALAHPSVVAINTTSGWKGHADLRFHAPTLSEADRADFFLVRGGQLVAHDLNGTAFVQWFTDRFAQSVIDTRRSEPDDLFRQRTFVIFGAGGAGSSVAEALSAAGAPDPVLVDNAFRYANDLSRGRVIELGYLDDAYQLVVGSLWPIVIIDSTDGADREVLESLLAALPRTRGPDGLHHHNVLVDLRPVAPDALAMAHQHHAWRGYDGSGMNEKNDDAMLRLIAEEVARRPGAPPLHAPDPAAFGLLVHRTMSRLHTERVM